MKKSAGALSVDDISSDVIIQQEGTSLKRNQQVATVLPVMSYNEPAVAIYPVASYSGSRRKQQQHPVESLYESAVAMNTVASFAYPVASSTHPFASFVPVQARRRKTHVYVVSHTVEVVVHLWSLGVLTAAGCGIGSVHVVVRSNLLVEPSEVEEGEINADVVGSAVVLTWISDVVEKQHFGIKCWSRKTFTVKGSVAWFYPADGLVDQLLIARMTCAMRRRLVALDSSREALSSYTIRGGCSWLDRDRKVVVFGRVFVRAGCEGERLYHTLISLLGLLALMRRVAPGSDQFHYGIGTSTVEQLQPRNPIHNQNLNSFVGLYYMTNESFTNGISSPRWSEQLPPKEAATAARQLRGERMRMRKI
ncbi:hypothetical protein F511_26985 [Dorcoceras hygrometricum]|uniref:Uncharacterized protein n=1 Tax=Dorcoceras hygrometricum TaxID=472368 RepID=A0A2Z7ABI6_9LAMI|nr:hypothetical protein F511_26985 [Dorcoceras hygrometricum]